MNMFSTYLTDSSTMLRRNLRHMRRYPMIFFIAGMPVVFLLLFVFVFGGTMGAGLGGVEGAVPSTSPTSSPGSWSSRWRGVRRERRSRWRWT